jgi:hypothetical protein
MLACCPECSVNAGVVMRTRVLRNDTRRRRYECRSCGHRWTVVDGEVPARLHPRRDRSKPVSRKGFDIEAVQAILTSREGDGAIAEVYGCTRQAINQLRTGRTHAEVLPELPRRGAVLCYSCKHWSKDRCGFDLPEAGSPESTDCNYYDR